MNNMKKIGVFLMCTTMLLMSGCHWFSGGGWFAGLLGGKAHFGFEMYCAETGEAPPGFPWVFYDGEIQFMDRKAGVRFHGDFVWNVAVTDGVSSCEEAAQLLVDDFGGSHYEALGIFGTCRTQPGNVPGTFTLSVVDDGSPGVGAEDWIEVTTNCTSDGSFYSNSGILGGGNITSEGHG
jgi:hypothetical protein